LPRRQHPPPGAAVIVQPSEQRERFAADQFGRASIEVPATCARAFLRGFRVLGRRP